MPDGGRLSDAAPVFLLLAFLFFIGVVLYVPLRWLAMRSVKPKEVPPDVLDPKRTHLTCLEVFALVLPLCLGIASPLVGVVIVLSTAPDDQQFSDVVGWLFLGSIVVLSIVGAKIGQALSRLLLQRSRYSARWRDDE